MDDQPDTNEIHDDLRAALDLASKIHDDAAHPASGVRQALIKLMESAALLDTTLRDGGQLPAAWAQAQQLQGPLGDLCEDAWAIIRGAAARRPGWDQAAARWQAQWNTVLAGAVPEPGEDHWPDTGTSADVQLAYLEQACDAVDVLVSTIKLDGDLADSEVGELHAKAAHLVGCVSAVNHMARQDGELPGEWLRPWLRARQATLAAPIATLIAAGETALRYRHLSFAGLDARPPGFWGRVEIPGMRNDTGWIADEDGRRVVRDWDGRVVAEVWPGPNARIVRLPTPVRRPDPVTGIYQTRPDTPEDPFGEVFGSEYRPYD